MNEQIISVKEARKLLEGKARTLPDAEVERIIAELDFMAIKAIKDHAVQKKEKCK